MQLGGGELHSFKHCRRKQVEAKVAGFTPVLKDQNWFMWAWTTLAGKRTWR